MDDKSIEQLEVILGCGGIATKESFAFRSRTETERVLLEYSLPLAQAGTPLTQEDIDYHRGRTEEMLKKGGYV